MKLTLRNLLAYLDDTLPPAAARQISQKIAQNAEIQQLAERITYQVKHQVNPLPLAGGKLDVNTVAEWLSNDLPPERAPQVDAVLLASDQHLAEVAACHQILTLFEAEPLTVPILTRKRMYGLTRKAASKAALVVNKPLPPEPEDEIDEEETDESLDEEELPEYLADDLRRRRLISSIIGVALLLILVFAVWRFWPASRPAGSTEVARNATSPELMPMPAEEPDTRPAATIKVARPPASLPGDGATAKDPKDNTGKTTVPDKKDDKVEKVPIHEPPANGPSKERREGIGRQRPPETGPAPVLLRHSPVKGTWELVGRENSVASTDTLLCLPGCRSEILLESGVSLGLHGHAADFYPASFDYYPPVQESRVVVNLPETNYDADLTVERGRILLVNNKPAGKAVVRVRFLDEIWDITLTENAVACVEMIAGYLPDTPFDKTGKGEGPFYETRLLGLKGTSALKVRYRELPLAEKTFYPWNSREGNPHGILPLPNLPRWVSDPKPPSSNFALDLKVATEELAARLVPGKSADVALAEMRKDSRPSNRRLAIRSMAAIDAITQLMDVLADEKDAHDRDFATHSLRLWIAWKHDHELKLYRALQEKMGYRPLEAEVVLELLHTFSPQEVANPVTYEKLIANLTDRRLAIRHLSYWHLLGMVQVPEARKIPYDPAGTRANLEAGQRAWSKLIPEGKLPPRPKTK